MYNDPIVSSLYALTFSRPRGFVNTNAPSQGWVMVYVNIGHMEMRMKSESLHMHTGDTVFIPPGVRRKVYFLAETTRFTCFYFSLLSGDLSRGVCKLPASAETDAILAPVYAELADGRSDGCRCFAALYALLAICRRQAPIPEKYRPLLPAIRFIDGHFKENHKVGEYAAMCAMSETAFRRLFVEYTGLSPVDYRNRLRLRHAEALILDGSTVAEAACAVGFAGTSPYYRILKRNRG